MVFNRVVTAMITPFNESDEIDYQETKKLIDYLLTNGTEALVAIGTTGESPTLTHKEKLQFLTFVVDYVSGRVPVIAGTGSNDTKASVIFTKEAEEIGVDGIMLVTPYYNKPSQAGMYAHFKTIAQATHLPVMLYNIPGRTVVRLELETIKRLALIDNIVAIKEATGDLDLIANIIKETPDDFYLYSGDDHLLLPILSLGGHGVVSVVSHLAGQELKEMIHLYEEGRVKEASRLTHKLSPLISAIFCAPNPTAVKYALTKKQFNVNRVRLPLIELCDKEKEVVDRALTAFNR